MTGQELAIHDITVVLENALEVVDSLGLVVEISLQSQQPPAMGNYKPVLSVRPKVDYGKS